MIKRFISLILILLIAWFLTNVLYEWRPEQTLPAVAHTYVANEAAQLGAMNVVTAIVVTYRGLDTLGEVTVLFLAASGIAVLMRRRKKNIMPAITHTRPASEIVQTGAALLVPFIVMFGVYIFLNGHLSPGGGFQGGAVVASAILMRFLANPDYKLKHTPLDFLESFAGFGYVLIGLLGIFFAGGFLDNRILPLGEFGTLLSAGAIPIIYTLIGLKVGTELAAILENLKGQHA